MYVWNVETCGSDEKEIAYKISVRLLEGRDSSGDQRTDERIVEDSITQSCIEEIGRKSVDWNQAVWDWDQWWVILNTTLNHNVS
jgi:hypothetical protein